MNTTNTNSNSNTENSMVIKEDISECRKKIDSILSKLETNTNTIIKIKVSDENKKNLN